MNAVLLDPGAPETCQPITSTRALLACPVAGRRLGELLRDRLAAAGFASSASAGGGPVLVVRGDAWLSADLLRRLAASRDPQVVADPDGEPLAWIADWPEQPPGPATLPADDRTFRIRYPWDLLRANEEALAERPIGGIEGEVSPAAHIEGRLALGQGSRVLPGVFIEGTVVIGADTRVGPNCYLRGATAIGSRCRIGQAVEIKNSLIMDDVGIGHLSYCGDSVIGERSNLGAGTITANFRHDGAEHRSRVAGRVVATGRRKLGAFLGDQVHTGIHTSLYPGRKIWPNGWTRPGEVVEHDLRREGLA
jgi:bifunctional UDP-N-acetylglucosamine pyrophosphorylase/glucosamine-1-phosphate N-acetyltransferase